MTPSFPTRNHNSMHVLKKSALIFVKAADAYGLPSSYFG